MSRGVLLSLILALTAPSFAQTPSGGMLSLSCVEALVAIDQSHLAGVFSFIAEKDSPAAFADLIVHDKKALKKYIAKLEKDRKEAGGISTWDHEAVGFALTIYGSPLAETLDKPGEGALKTLVELSKGPKMSLADLTAKRRKP